MVNPEISQRRKAKQARAIATVEALLEAGTYVLEHEGVSAFTTNRVAERAGVNIASLYQYYPNKEALLFHIAQCAWERQLARLSPLLSEAGVAGAVRLRRFIVAFFEVEAAEVDLRRALQAASVDLRSTAQFSALLQQGAELTRMFLEEQAPGIKAEERDFMVDFMVNLITSFAERSTDLGTPAETLRRQADLLSDMLIARLALDGGHSA